MRYLIIGNGAAGIAAAEKIRKLDKKGEITILTAENHAVYSKCLLPDFLSGNISEDRLFIRDIGFHEKKNIVVHYNHKVLDIDFVQKQVMTGNSDDFSETSSVFKYDKLLIASGSIQFLPAIRGLNLTNVYFLGTLDEAKRILEDSRNAKRIVIIGGGFVGLEAAFNLYKKDKKVTVIEKAARVLSGQIDERASGIIQNSAEEEGIHLILGTSVSEVSSSAYTNIARLFKGVDEKSVFLNDGRRLKADMIIVATGSRPNLVFVKDSRLTLNRGIIVNNHMQTSIEDVYAAGDVVESIDAVTGEKSLSPVWPNAVIQGEAAGSNMAGSKQEFSSLISMQNASEFREIPMISMGITAPSEPGYEEYWDYRPFDMVYRKLVIKDSIIVGMIFLGDIRNSGVISALMKQKITIGKIKSNLLNTNFGYSEASNLS